MRAYLRSSLSSGIVNQEVHPTIMSAHHYDVGDKLYIDHVEGSYR